MEAAAEADLCGVEAVRRDSEYVWAVGYVEQLWTLACGGQSVEAGGRCRLMEAGVCERG